MIEKHFEFIANYLWQKSMENINTILSSDEKKQFNITDYFYLTMIYNMGNPNFGDVAEKLKLTKPAVSALVKRLSKNELVEKIQSEEDGRIYYLKLTEKGIRIIEGDNKLYNRFSGLIKERLSEDKMRELDNLLSSIIDVLKNE